MNNANKKRTGWKQKFLHELIEYWTNVVYLAIFFGVFFSYRRLILAHYEISYLNYGIGVIKALILAKVIMIVGVFRPGQSFENRPLIFPTLYKSVVFTISVALFSVLESMARGLLDGKGLAGGWDELMGRGTNELLAGCLVTFFAFVPFFATKELGRVMGEGRIQELFFRRRAAAKSDLSS